MKAIVVSKDGTRREVPAVFVPGDGGNCIGRLDFIEPITVTNEDSIDLQFEISDVDLTERIKASMRGPISFGYKVYNVRD